MRIIKYGSTTWQEIQFKCGKCGCEFIANRLEYEIKISDSFNPNKPIINAYCSCPECEKECCNNIPNCYGLEKK